MYGTPGIAVGYAGLILAVQSSLGYVRCASGVAVDVVARDFHISSHDGRIEIDTINS